MILVNGGGSPRYRTTRTLGVKSENTMRVGDQWLHGCFLGVIIGAAGMGFVFLRENWMIEFVVGFLCLAVVYGAMFGSMYVYTQLNDPRQRRWFLITCGLVLICAVVLVPLVMLVMHA